MKNDSPTPIQAPKDYVFSKKRKNVRKNNKKRQKISKLELSNNLQQENLNHLSTIKDGLLKEWENVEKESYSTNSLSIKLFTKLKERNASFDQLVIINHIVQNWIVETIYYRYKLFNKPINASVMHKIADYIIPSSLAQITRNHTLRIGDKPLTTDGIIANKKITFEDQYGLLNCRNFPNDYRLLSKEQTIAVFSKLKSEEFQFLGKELQRKLCSSYLNFTPEKINYLNAKKLLLLKERTSLSFINKELTRDVNTYLLEQLYYRFVKPERFVDFLLLKEIALKGLTPSYQERQEFYEELNRKKINKNNLSALGRLRCIEHYPTDF